ncbi:MAG TPA: enoyl-CoA hydratase/isomerase family protein [Blastocatellia bacterium]|nr:enoyl-CoA hydratase/isomerase family protein [Blastocatellia bacterium]
MTAVAQLEDVEVIQLNLGSANAINPQFLEHLNQRLSDVEQTGAKAALITGYEKFFCAGLDLVTLFDLSRSEMEAFVGNFKQTFLRLFSFPKPVVAAINGHAIAGGCVMALGCDYRVMGRGTSLIGLNEIKLGIALPTIVLEFVKAALPPHSFPQVLYMGGLFQPQKAVTLHLIDELVESSSVLRRSIAVAGEFGNYGAAFSQIKKDTRASFVEQIRAADNTSEWLDLWFSDETRRVLGEIRDGMLARRQQRTEKEEAEAAAQQQKESTTQAEEPAPEQPKQQIIYQDSGEVLERISDEDIESADKPAPDQGES